MNKKRISKIYAILIAIVLFALVMVFSLSRVNAQSSNVANSSISVGLSAGYSANWYNGGDGYWYLQVIDNSTGLANENLDYILFVASGAEFLSTDPRFTILELYNELGWETTIYKFNIYDFGAIEILGYGDPVDVYYYGHLGDDIKVMTTVNPHSWKYRVVDNSSAQGFDYGYYTGYEDGLSDGGIAFVGSSEYDSLIANERIQAVIDYQNSTEYQNVLDNVRNDGYNDGLIDQDNGNPILTWAGSLLGSIFSFVLFLFTNFSLFGINGLTVIISIVIFGAVIFVVKKML